MVSPEISQNSPKSAIQNSNIETGSEKSEEDGAEAARPSAQLGNGSVDRRDFFDNHLRWCSIADFPKILGAACAALTAICRIRISSCMTAAARAKLCFLIDYGSVDRPDCFKDHSVLTHTVTFHTIAGAACSE